jgi:hypothetical protein
MSRLFAILRRPVVFVALSVALTVTVLLAVLAFAVSPATTHAAGKPQDVTETLVRIQGTPGGSWSLTGAINDSGTWVFDSQRFDGYAPNTYTAHLLITLTGLDPNNTFTEEAQVLFKVTADPNVASGQNHWHINGGTGTYAHLQGEGELTGMVDFSQPTQTLSGPGQVHWSS